MALCRQYSIPLSEFHSWDEQDQEAALEFEAYLAAICQRCGTNPDDWMDGTGRPIEPPPYRAITTNCMGCAALEESRASVDDKTKTSIMHRLVKVPRKLAERELQKWQMSRSK